MLNLFLIPSSVLMILRSPARNEYLFLTSLLLSKKYRISIAVKIVVRPKRIHGMLSTCKFILICYLLVAFSVLILHPTLNLSAYILISIQSMKRYLVTFLVGMRSPLTTGLLLLLLMIISHILVRIHL